MENNAKYFTKNGKQQKEKRAEKSALLGGENMMDQASQGYFPVHHSKGARSPKANRTVSRALCGSHKRQLGHTELGTAVGDERELFFLPDALTRERRGGGDGVKAHRVAPGDESTLCL